MSTKNVEWEATKAAEIRRLICTERTLEGLSVAVHRLFLKGASVDIEWDNPNHKGHRTVMVLPKGYPHLITVHVPLSEVPHKVEA